MRRRWFKNQKGQTAIEYIMMLFVCVGLGTVMFKKLNTFLIGSNGTIAGNIRYFQAMLASDPRYKYFKLPR